MRDIGEQQFSKVASGDTKPNSWTLLDFGKSLPLILALFISYCHLILKVLTKKIFTMFESDAL
jgi:hypothetical protein